MAPERGMESGGYAGIKPGQKRGGVLPTMMAAEDYLRHAIALANAREDDPRLLDLYETAMNVRVTRTFINPEWVATKQKAAKQLRRELIRQFEKIVLGRGKPDLSEVAKYLGDVETVTSLGVDANGSLEHRHRYFPQSTDAAAGLAVAFLVDPTRPYASKFGVCALPACSQFFIAPHDQMGRRHYCSPEHQQIARRPRNAAAVARHRARKHK